MRRCLICSCDRSPPLFSCSSSSFSFALSPEILTSCVSLASCDRWSLPLPDASGGEAVAPLAGTGFLLTGSSPRFTSLLETGVRMRWRYLMMPGVSPSASLMSTR